MAGARLTLLIGLVAAGLVVGTVLVIGAPYLAIPIVLLFFAGWFGYRVVQRGRERTSMRSERERVETPKFTERDRATMTETRETPTGGG
jgi:hypothetical protein